MVKANVKRTNPRANRRTKIKNRKAGVRGSMTKTILVERIPTASKKKQRQRAIRYNNLAKAERAKLEKQGISAEHLDMVVDAAVAEEVERVEAARAAASGGAGGAGAAPAKTAPRRRSARKAAQDKSGDVEM